MKAPLLASLLLASCATAHNQPTPCRTATQILQDRDYFVISCWKYTYPDCGEKVAKCLVIDQDGREYEKTVFTQFCGL